MIWGEEAERFAFEDRWKGGINAYLNNLMERIQKLYEKLKPTGLIFVHLDWHICHYVKVEMDKIFGYRRFLNEIIWYYKTGGMSRRWFGRKHDNILLYSKTGEYQFNQLKEKSYLAHKYGFSNIEIKEDEEGYYTEVGMRDVWDIPALRGNQPETLGYPTQKPVALLERIIRVSTNPGDIVLDAYCGCGTTLAAAQNLGRRWIGIDVSQSAIRVVEQRLKKIGAINFEVHGLVKSLKQLRELEPFEFQNWAINAVYGQHSPRKVSDMGIDGFTFMEHHPIQVKQTDHVGRPVIDNFAGVLQRQKEKRGMVIAFGFTSGAIDEVARLEREDKIKIELVKCAELVAGNVPYKIMI
jgi:DNA modification methylase